MLAIQDLPYIFQRGGGIKLDQCFCSLLNFYGQTNIVLIVIVIVVIVIVTVVVVVVIIIRYFDSCRI